MIHTQPEFDFTEGPHSDVVDEDNGDQEDRDEDARIDLLRWTPVLDNQSGSGELIWCYDDVFEPVCL